MIKKLKFTELANLLEKKFKPLAIGTPVLTLKEICEKYKVSLSTAKRAILELQQRDVIYSQPGRGSFVAPPTRKKVILFVFSMNKDLSNNDFFNASILMHSLSLCNSYNSNYTISAIDFDDFEKNYAHLDKIYSLVKGVVFLRYITPYLEQINFLINSNIPCFFYGSSAYKKDFKNINNMVYNEENIMHIVFEELQKGNKKSPAIIGNWNFAVNNARLKYFKKNIANYNMELNKNLIISEENFKSYNNQEIRKILCDCDSIIAVDGRIALYINQKLKAVGFKTPADIALISINNENYLNFIEPGISSVALDSGEDIDLMFDGIIEKIEENKNFAKETNSILIKRATT